MTEYIVTKWYDEHNCTCLEYTCGVNKEHAEKVKAECEAKDPNSKYFVEEVKKEDQWWNQGWLD